MHRDSVDWEKASCRGLDTEIFYMYEDELMEKEYISLMTLRKLCFSCPIWRECLTIGFKYERYGHWGGLAADERNHIVAGLNSKKYIRMRNQIDELGIDYEEIFKIGQVKRELLW